MKVSCENEIPIRALNNNLGSYLFEIVSTVYQMWKKYITPFVDRCSPLTISSCSFDSRSELRRSRSLSSRDSCSDDNIDSDSDDDHEEDFYWTEVEVDVATSVDSTTGETSFHIINGPPGVIVNNVMAPQSPGGVIAPTAPAASMPQIPTVPVPQLISPTSSTEPVQQAPSSIISLNPPISPNAKMGPQATLKPLTNKPVPVLTHGTKLMFGGPPMKSQQFPQHVGSQFRSQEGHHIVSVAHGTSPSQLVKLSPQPTLSHMDMARPPHEGYHFFYIFLTFVVKK